VYASAQGRSAGELSVVDRRKILRDFEPAAVPPNRIDEFRGLIRFAELQLLEPDQVRLRTIKM
jgi:hypothetical protein